MHDISRQSVVSLCVPHLPFQLREGTRIYVLCVFAVLVCLALGGVYFLIYGLGGTRLGYLHVIYVPILFAAAVFVLPGGIIAALGAGILMGPAMPLDVALGTPQPLESWVVRMILFLLVGGTAGLLFGSLYRYANRVHDLHAHDRRTGIPNRTAFDEMLRRHPAMRTGHCLALEINGYDDVLVVLGPEMAETWVRAMGERLVSVLPEGAYLFHYRSARFGIWLPASDPEQALEAGKAIVAAFEGTVEVDTFRFHVMAIFGLTPVASHSPTQLLQIMSAAVESAIQSDQRYIVYDDAILQQRKDMVDLAGALKDVLASGKGLSLHYQPKMDLATGRCIGGEALLRWHDPERGMIPPAEFIPVVEHTAQMRDLTRWVVRQATADLVEGRLPAEVRISVNISVRDLEDPDFPAFLETVLGEAKIAPGRLWIEVTETALTRDLERVVAALRQVRALGIKVSIDDFGTGHASFEYIRNLPVDAIKIDKLFIQGLPDRWDEAICRAAIRLGRDLDLELLAEGVEDTRTGDWLLAHGCGLAQGFAYARPLPSDRFFAFLENANRSR